jgi:DNA-binding transcriptional MerR regulator
VTYGTMGAMADHLLSIGELSDRTGVAITALRYYDELGLVRPTARSSGRRRYDPQAVRVVGAVLFLREVGFSLAEAAALLTHSWPVAADGSDRGATGDADWPSLVDRKLAEVEAQQQRLAVARAALEHGKACPAGDPSRCPRFWALIDARLEGAPLAEVHAAG